MQKPFKNPFTALVVLRWAETTFLDPFLIGLDPLTLQHEGLKIHILSKVYNMKRRTTKIFLTSQAGV